MIKHYNIPIFLPELACPYRCVYCNQFSITGLNDIVKAEDVKTIIDSHLSSFKEENRFVELRGTKAGLKWKDNEVEFFTEEDGQLLDINPSGNIDTNGHKKNICNFIDVLLEGAEPVFKPSQGVDMIKILCAIYESAEKGKEIVL